MRVLKREAQVQLHVKGRYDDVIRPQGALAAVHPRRQYDCAGAGPCARAASRVAQGTADAQPGYAQRAESVEDKKVGKFR